MDLSIIVVNYHTNFMLKRFLCSLELHWPNLEVEVFVEDVEADGFNNPTNIPIHYRSHQQNIGYARAVNAASKQATGTTLGIFNADTKFTNGECLPYCHEYLISNPDVGAVGPLQTDSRGRVTAAGFFGPPERPKDRGFRSRYPQRYTSNEEAVTISGSAFFVPQKIWNDMLECPIYQKTFPGVDGALLPTHLYFEETGLMYHLRIHDYKVMFLGQASMIHEWHMSSPVGSQTRKAVASRKVFREFCDAHGIPRP